MVEVSRMGPLKTNKEQFMGYILLNPNRKGLVEEKLVVTLQGVRSNKTYTLEIPIIALVHPESNVLRLSTY
jgi:hypothetical protein